MLRGFTSLHIASLLSSFMAHCFEGPSTGCRALAKAQGESADHGMENGSKWIKNLSPVQPVPKYHQIPRSVQMNTERQTCDAFPNSVDLTSRSSLRDPSGTLADSICWHRNCPGQRCQRAEVIDSRWAPRIQKSDAKVEFASFSC